MALATEVLLETLLGCIPVSMMYGACMGCALVTDASPLGLHASFVCFARLFCQLTNTLAAEEVERRMIEVDFEIVKFLINRWSCERLDVRRAVVTALAQLAVKLGKQ